MFLLCFLSTSLQIRSFFFSLVRDIYSIRRCNNNNTFYSISFFLFYLTFSSLYRQTIQQILFYFDGYLRIFFYHCRDFLLLLLAEQESDRFYCSFSHTRHLPRSTTSIYNKKLFYILHTQKQQVKAH